MRGTVLAATLVAISASALLVGCGQAGSIQTAGQPRSAPMRLAPRVVRPAACVTPRNGSGLTISEKDNGKRFCVTAGAGVFVFLRSTPGRMWAGIHPSSTALVPRPSGELALARGVTGGFFVATGLGTVTLTSTRAPCRTGATVHCSAQTLFRVTVVIRGRM